MYTAQLAKHLSLQDDVVVATTRRVISLPSGTVRRYEHEGVPVVEVVNNVDYDSVEETWKNPLMEQAFEQVLDETRPDVVHFQHLLYWSAAAPALVRERGLPCLATLHDFWLACARMGQLVDYQDRLCDGPSEERCAPCMAATPYGQDQRARRWIRRLILLRRLTGIALDEPLRRLKNRFESSTTDSRHLERSSTGDLLQWRRAYLRRVDAFADAMGAVDRFVTSSRDLRRRFIEWGMAESQIAWLPYGLDHGPFESVAHRRRSETEPLRVGFIGTIAAHKAPDVLVRAVADLPPDKVRLTIYGPEFQQPAYAARCRELAAPLSHVEMGGFLHRDRVPEALASLDVLCVPSVWYECSPLTILEAQIAGVPCIVSSLGGMAEMVRSGVDGLLAEPGDVEDWRRAIMELAEDRRLVERLAANQPRVETTAENAQRLREHWRELLAS